MKPEKHQSSLSVQNFDKILPQKPKRNRHGDLLPNTVRALLSGSSSCGKTNLLFTLLTDINGLRFENLHVYSKSLTQPKYVFLRDLMSQVQNVDYFCSSDNSEVVSPEDVKPNSIIIFDDFVCEKQDNVRNFYSRGRHRDCDIIFLTQSYSRVQKLLIRDNCNLIILFKQDDLNLKHVYNDHVSCDMTYDKFKQFCAACWNADKYGFVVISTDDDLKQGRYRHGFDRFIDVS